MFKKFTSNIILTIITWSSLSLFTGGVNALDYGADLEFDLTISENRTAAILQEVTITNNSPDFLSTSLSLDFPFENVSNLQVESEGVQLPASIENGRLWVEFVEQSLDYGEQKLILIKYQIPNFVETYGEIRAINWPSFNIEEQPTEYPLRINYPIGWDDVVYSTQGIDMNVAFETKRALAINKVSKPISVFVGKYSLKQAQLVIDQDVLLADRTELTLPLNDDFYISSANDSTSIKIENGSTFLSVNLAKYLESKGIRMISRVEAEFTENATLGKYHLGSDRITGIDTSDPARIYKVLSTRLTPDKEITQWTRLTVTEILEKESHSDLDYANVFVSVLRSKGIPAQILYGLAKYPDGQYYWHFWVAYLDMSTETPIWKQIDPYLGVVTGDENFQNVSPLRIVWGELKDNSDLSDLSVDLFSLRPENFQFKYFSSSSAQTGYITSQLNNQNFVVNDESVMGASTNNIETDRGLMISIVLVSTGLSLIIFAGVTYKLRFKEHLNPN